MRWVIQQIACTRRGAVVGSVAAHPSTLIQPAWRSLAIRSSPSASHSFHFQCILACSLYYHKTPSAISIKTICALSMKGVADSLVDTPPSPFITGCADGKRTAADVISGVSDRRPGNSVAFSSSNLKHLTLHTTDVSGSLSESAESWASPLPVLLLSTQCSKPLPVLELTDYHLGAA